MTLMQCRRILHLLHAGVDILQVPFEQIPGYNQDGTKKSVMMALKVVEKHLDAIGNDSLSREELLVAIVKEVEEVENALQKQESGQRLSPMEQRSLVESWIVQGATEIHAQREETNPSRAELQVDLSKLPSPFQREKDIVFIQAAAKALLEELIAS